MQDRVPQAMESQHLGLHAQAHMDLCFVGRSKWAACHVDELWLKKSRASSEKYFADYGFQNASEVGVLLPAGVRGL